MENDAPFARHLIDRLGYGPRPGDLDAIQRFGAEKWIDAQLHPDNVALPQALTTQLLSLTTQRMTPPEIFMEYGPPSYRNLKQEGDTEAFKAAVGRAKIIGTEAVESRLSRALLSPRQLEERMVEFWFNHFNVFAGKGLDRLWIGSYEAQAIRPHVFGKFHDLLAATARHPAMLFYLDNWQNTAPGSRGARGNFQGLNENYARELMELHTLGVDGGYSQDDVIALARILTGWGFGGDRGDGDAAPPRSPMARLIMQRPNLMRAVAHNARAFRFNPERHDTGDKHFLGHVIRGRSGENGIEEGEEALDILARAPATARHVSFQLAQFFVADAPDDELVGAMAREFQSSGGDMRAVLRTMIASRAFQDPTKFGTRFKTPYQYVVSAVRASDVAVRNIKPLYGTLMQLGQPLYGCQTPDGFKCTEEAWLSPDAITRRISFAVALGSGHLPLALDTEPKEVNVRRADKAPPPPALLKAEAQTNTVTEVSAERVLAALGQAVPAATLAVVNQAPPQLQAGLLLGSPDFMRC